MPIILKFDPNIISKEDQVRVTNDRLKALLNQREPTVIRFLARMWRKQQSDITYEELRNMTSGIFQSELLERWQEDYSRFVVDTLMPQWRDLISEAAYPVEQRFPAWEFNPYTEQIARYTANHAAEFVKNSTQTQIDAINALVQRAATLQNIPADELARQIRPAIGLYRGQATANLNYYNSVKNALQEMNPRMKPGTVEARARAAADKYAAVQHRYRAQMISRTELSAAYNAGEHGTIKQAQEQGLIGRVIKEWVTAGDLRVCDRCRQLDGTKVDMDEEFPGESVDIPPLHPHCRCVCNYTEI